MVMKDILVYTAAYYGDPSATRYLDASCELLGIELHKYGAGEGFPGYMTAKVDHNIEFLEQHAGGYTHALFCDASDTFCLRPLADIWQVYQGFNSPLVVSVEPECYPYSEKLLHSYPSSPTRWRFINSGHYMGEYGYLLGCLKKLRKAGEDKELQDSDQSYWHAAFSADTVKPALDYYCRLFQPMAIHHGDVVQTADGRVYNRATSSYPCAVHFNGQSGNIGEWFKKWRAGR